GPGLVRLAGVPRGSTDSARCKQGQDGHIRRLAVGATCCYRRSLARLPPAIPTEVLMRRIGLVLVLGLALGSFRAEAQQAGKVARIGFLCPSSPSDGRGNPSDLAILFEALRVTLRERGYVEDQNIKIEWRWAEGNYDRLPGLADDLVRLKVAVIVTYGTP